MKSTFMYIAFRPIYFYSLKYNAMIRILAITLLLLLLPAISTFAADHKVEALKEGPPGEGISPQVAATLGSSGLRVKRGTATLCDIWLCKEWAVPADFKPTTQVLYPFKVGQLIGIVKFARRGSDFRDQDVPSGLYTLRYAQQPVDGKHVGTSPTRDFLLLTKAADDSSPEALDYNKLAKQSAEAAGSSHPALLPLQRVEGEAELPAIRHDEEHDWWIIRFAGQVKAGDAAKPLVVELLVAGKAAE